jgi:sugar-specific transcriptional regulator TrmB
MTAKELAKMSGVRLWKVYYVATKLGRLPSVEELANWKQKRGRPPKNWGNNEKGELE